MALEIIIDKVGNNEILRIRGRSIDIDAKKLKRKLEFFYRKHPDIMIVDITETEFMDSYSLGVIVYYHTLMQKSGNSLILVNVDPDKTSYMNKLLELTRLILVFNVVDSYDKISDFVNN